MELADDRSRVFDSYPDGGFRAYSIVFGAWLALLPASGLLNSTGIFQAWLLKHELRSYTEAQIAWIFSFFAFLFFFGGCQAGPLFDRYGLTYLLPCGAFGLVISLICTSFCKEYYQFMLAFGLLGGISSSIIWTSSIATVGHWFMRNRGIAMGLATSAGGFGGVCYPLVFARLSRQIGFPWTMRVFALISGLSFFCSFVLMRTRLPRNSSSHVLFDWQGFKDMRFTITMAAIFILDWAVMVPPAYITTYATARGFDTISPHILAILNAASIIGRGLPGLVADKIGRFNVMIMCSIMSALSIFSFWLSSTSNAGLLVGFAVSYGFFSGSAFSLTPVCVAQLCNTEEFATRYGTAYSVVSLATLAGVPISGIILDSGTSDQYLALIIFSGVAYTAATILFFIARGVSYGWALTGVF